MRYQYFGENGETGFFSCDLDFDTLSRLAALEADDEGVEKVTYVPADGKLPAFYEAEYAGDKSLRFCAINDIEAINIAKLWVKERGALISLKELDDFMNVTRVVI